jgi:hypothetical protein
MAPILAKIPREGLNGFTKLSSTDGVPDCTSIGAKPLSTASQIRHLDCELIACDETGMPNFRTLMELANKAPALCLWCFDLLSLDGVRLTPLPLSERKAMLADVIADTDDEHMQFSGAFDDPIGLLKTCEKMHLEGIVSKRRESPYTSGPTRDWLKILTKAWRAANAERFELLQSGPLFYLRATTDKKPFFGCRCW